ncbi:MAG: response regulator transcription factor, partial [Gammaproteobacteria bacterium]|nr:response regulator transcription factor [Gammaproteobacteria bacterium]
GAPEDLSALIRQEHPELVLLDLALPGRDGVDWFGNIPELSEGPVIFLSGYGHDETFGRALELGAQDYIVKPFSPTELVTRVGAALRRHREPEPFVLGELAIDHGARRVTLRGEAVELTATEYELLRLLSVNAGHVVHRETMLHRIRGARGGVSPNLIRIYIRNLRRKLGDDAQDPTWIFNHRGVGYRMPRPEDFQQGPDTPDEA